MQRRALLVAVGTVLAGCAGGDAANDATTATTGEPTDATRGGTADTTRPNGTGTDSPPSIDSDVPAVPRDCVASTTRAVPPGYSYPALPAEVTEETARRFAREFETAVGLADVYADERWSFDGTDGAWTEHAAQTDAGFVVKATVSQYMHGNGTLTTAVGSTESSGWYHVTPDGAMRSGWRSGTSPPADGWRVVACD
jgi:hypothetical protein